MAVRTERSVFYHVPKTGGIWVKEAMRKSGLRYDRCKNMKVGQAFGLKREHATPGVVCTEHKDGLFSFCFVRHPVGWYKSFWCYRVKTQYLDRKFPADRLWDDEFEKFILQILEAYPDGFVTQVYQYYVGEDAKEIDFIGRQENLADDLVTVLSLAGEDFDEERLRATRWRNISAANRKFGDLCTLSDQTEKRILDVEAWVISHFYPQVAVANGAKSAATSII